MVRINLYVLLYVLYAFVVQTNLYVLLYVLYAFVVQTNLYVLNSSIKKSFYKFNQDVIPNTRQVRTKSI